MPILSAVQDKKRQEIFLLLNIDNLYLIANTRYNKNDSFIYRYR